MTRFVQWSTRIMTLRDEIDKLMSEDAYQVEEVAAKTTSLHSLIDITPEDIADANEYSEFLNDNLQWIMLVIAKLNDEKNLVASSILRSQRSKKAEKLYGENK